MNNHYRTYMDRIHTPAELHDALTAGKPPSRQPSRVLRFVPAAACCALVLAGCLWGVRLASGFPGPGVEPVAAGTPAPAENTVSGSPGGTQTESSVPGTPAPASRDPGAFTLLVEDPFDGQPHGDFVLPGVEFNQCSTGGMVLDYALGNGNQTTVRLTAAEMSRALGGGESGDVPWTLSWAGFSLMGFAEFDEDENLLRAVISGQREKTTIGLTLTPGRLPPVDVLYPEAVEQDYPLNGAPVKAYFVDLDNGEYLYQAEAMSGDTGVRLDVTGPDQEEAAHLVLCFLRAAAGQGDFTAKGLALTPDSAVSRVDLVVGLEEAKADELGRYVPRYVPEGFVYGSGGIHTAWNESGYQTIKTLAASWNHGYSYVDLVVHQSTERRSNFVLAPEEPGIAAGGVTAGVLEDIGTYVDGDKGDVPGWRFRFAVDYGWEDGSFTIVTYSIKGLSPQEAALVVNSCPYGMCRLPPAPTPSAAAE